MDLKERLVEGMKGQGILLDTERGARWVWIDSKNRALIAERVLSIPGINISESEA